MTRDTAEERAAVVAHLLSYADELRSSAEENPSMGAELRAAAQSVQQSARLIAEGRHVEEDK